jgi:flagellar operon protein
VKTEGVLQQNVSAATRLKQSVESTPDQSALKELWGDKGFQALLNDKVDEGKQLQFSAHAIKRMADRNIELSPLDMQKIQEALAKMASKGAKESLILSEKGAFIVNVKDNKVITAIDPESARDSTFTNIDSTVII